jgi:hypothetical protein
MEPEIKIVTVSTHESGYLKWLKESCIRHGTELQVLGTGVKWEGYITRSKILNKFLESENEENIVCVVDAYDVIMLKSVEELRNSFIRSGHKIIFSLTPTEHSNENIIGSLVQEYLRVEFSVKDGLQHINPGLYMGYVKDLKEMNNEIMRMYFQSRQCDDEKLINIYYGLNSSHVFVDEQHNFFKNISPLDLVNKPSYNEHSFFLHRIGNAPLSNFLEANGYDVTPEEKVLLMMTFFDEISKKIPYHVMLFLKSILN